MQTKKVFVRVGMVIEVPKGKKVKSYIEQKLKSINSVMPSDIQIDGESYIPADYEQNIKEDIELS